jgi:MFS transporter, ACS family, tartrate transporter
MDEVEKRTVGKVMWRLVPFLVLCYFVAYLDRINVGVAKLQMNGALGLDNDMFGFGAGLFFVAYALLEVPSNIALNRFGARRWIARIMVTWGIISGAFAFIPHISAATGISHEYTFYLLRFLLGLAEAGFFPGVIFFLSLWFPAVYRARVISLFMLAIPFSSIIGNPLSSVFLNITGAGLAGWQWLYILEALPSIVIGLCVLFYLTDRPSDAHWLQNDEKAWLNGRLAQERQVKEQAEHFSILKAIVDPRILICAAIYFCLNAASYGTSFFLPSIFKSFGVTDSQAALLSAVPFLFGAVGMVLIGRSSDRTLKRREHVVAVMAITALGVAATGFASSIFVAMACLCFAQIGISAMPPVFWPLPASILTGASAAAGIAAINSVGNLSGLVGPWAMGYLQKNTGSFTSGLLVVAILAAIGGVTTLFFPNTAKLEQAPARVQPAE